MIDVRGLTKVIDTGTHRVDILKGIDFSVPKGQFVAIMGSSGSGKSTLLGLVAGLDTASTGEIWLDGEEITKLPEDKLAVLRGRKIGFVFQSYQLIPTLTAEENVLLPYELVGGNGNGPARAKELLNEVGVELSMLIHLADLRSDCVLCKLTDAVAEHLLIFGEGDEGLRTSENVFHKDSFWRN